MDAPCWCSIPDDAFLPNDQDEDIQNDMESQSNESYCSDEDMDSISVISMENDASLPQHSISDKFFCENEKKTIGIAFQASQQIPESLTPATYSVINILERSKRPPLLVWETARRPPEPILDTPRSKSCPFTKEQIIDQLKQNLDTIREFSSEHILWEQLDNMPGENLQDFYLKLTEAFKTANQYIAAYNPKISYCTGAHNNAVLLGGDQQAKAATFYLSPYMGKLKFPLQDCLVILQKAMTIVENYPDESAAPDKGTKERNSKRILQKCINKLNLKMELSDYQMAAVLLKLPSIVRSEQYALLNPHAHQAYITHVQRQRDSSKILDRLIEKANEEKDAMQTVNHEDTSFIADEEDEEEEENQEDIPVRTTLHDPTAILYELGYMENFVIKEQEKSYRTLFPQCSLYANRGQRLKHLNRMEYSALIKFRQPSTTAVKRQEEFPFSDGFVLSGLAVQAILAKQKTPMVIRKPPPHPGKRPNMNSDRYPTWLENANRYAEFFLTLFCPEPDCCEKKHVNTYSYTYDALEEFVSELMHDNSIISKFRLTAMHTRMRGFVTSYRSKLILTKYRSRDRDMWTKEQLQKWETRRAWEHAESKLNQKLEEMAFRAEHHNLGTKKTNALRQKLARAQHLTNTFCETFKTNQPPSRLFPAAISTTINSISNHSADVQEMGTCIHKFDKEGVPPTSQATRRPYKESYWRLKCLRKHRECIKPFKKRQRHLYERYKQYFKNLDSQQHAPPPVLLLHGGAGTGKSTLLRAILDYAEFNQVGTIQTAFNGINALHIKGDTTSSLLILEGKDANHLGGLTTDQLPIFRDQLNGSKLIVVDELSNQAPWHLAKLNLACQQAKGNSLPFGGVPIILCGDLMQLEPVRAGLSLPAAIIEMCENVWGNPSTKHLKRMRQKKKEANKRKKINKNDIDLTPNPYDERHPFAAGSTIMKHARWYELIEQVQTDDPKHAAFVTKLYNCRRPSMEDLKAIPILSKKDYNHPKSPWFKAPILVLTHRE